MNIQSRSFEAALDDCDLYLYQLLGNSEVYQATSARLYSLLDIFRGRAGRRRMKRRPDQDQQAAANFLDAARDELDERLPENTALEAYLALWNGLNAEVAL